MCSDFEAEFSNEDELWKLWKIYPFIGLGLYYHYKLYFYTFTEQFSSKIELKSLNRSLSQTSIALENFNAHGMTIEFFVRAVSMTALKIRCRID